MVAGGPHLRDISVEPWVWSWMRIWMRVWMYTYVDADWLWM